MRDLQASVIKVGAVVTAMPRWVGALLAAEGFALPSAWLVWWIPLSAVMSAAMAIVEGMAFAYVFEAWRNQRDRSGDRLLWFALVSALLFVLVLAPYVAASVREVSLSECLSADWALYSWSVAVGASTIAIVGTVGYAQKRRVSSLEREVSAPVSETKPAERHVCKRCGRSFASQQALSGHQRSHKEVGGVP